jgi:hypothetical protein
VGAYLGKPPPLLRILCSDGSGWDRLLRLADLAEIHTTLGHIFFENGIIIEINAMIVVQIVLHSYCLGLDFGREIRLDRGG